MYGSSSITGPDLPDNDLSNGSFPDFSDARSGSADAIAQPIVDPDPLAGLEMLDNKFNHIFPILQ